MENEKIAISTDFIKLDQFIKFAGLTGSGAEAKMLILNEDVLVNGEVCTQRGKKLLPNDRVVIDVLQADLTVVRQGE